MSETKTPAPLPEEPKTWFIGAGGRHGVWKSGFGDWVVNERKSPVYARGFETAGEALDWLRSQLIGKEGNEPA